ncbi:MAG TPA: hypothetical protein IGS40_28915 [Trichormus sp. M33_DOE_039]|nr:hypothetical protein [Trichormus sp. M33_DOE_039]
MLKTNECLLFTELTKEEAVAINGGNGNNILDLLQILLPLIPTSPSAPTPTTPPAPPYSPFVSPQYTGLNSAFTPVSGLVFSAFT